MTEIYRARNDTFVFPDRSKVNGLGKTKIAPGWVVGCWVDGGGRGGEVRGVWDSGRVKGVESGGGGEEARNQIHTNCDENV